MYGGILGREEENPDYGGMVQPSQQYVAPSVKVVEWRYGTRGEPTSVQTWAQISKTRVMLI